MNDWSHGYNVSVEYSFSFFREMAPQWLNFCVRAAGYDVPEREGSRQRYLELGCGQGLGLCILAAANPDMQFVGIDLQPEHIEHGTGLAEAAGLTNIRFVQGDFVLLAAAWPDDLGRFDYVALHGILSWISATVTEAVVECLRHATRAGSLVYAGYSTQPGWISTIPFQHFARLIKNSTDKAAPAIRAHSTQLFDRLAAGRAPIFQLLPGLQSRVDAVKAKDDNYFVHEYLNENWRPLWHSEAAAELRASGLEFAASATMAENLLPQVLQPALRGLIEEQPNDALRRDLQDLIVNQAFRRDIYIREAQPRAAAGLNSAGDTLLHLIPELEVGNFVQFETPFGRVRLEYANFVHVLDALADGPRSVSELLALKSPTAMTQEHLLTLLLHASILGAGNGNLAGVQGSERLNACIARAAATGAPYRDLAAAMFGAGIHVTERDLSLLNAWFESGKNSDERARGAHADAATFIRKTLPRWRALGVVA